MLGILVYIMLLAKSLAAITDPRCTVSDAGVLKYSPEAVNCHDKLSEDNCKLFYKTEVKVNMDTERDASCFMNPNGIDQQLVKRAVDSCPKRCGYCCITPAYNCLNKQNPRFPCSSVTPDMCTNNVWRSILADDCPKTCGLCAESSDCVDTTPYCTVDPSVCYNAQLQDFVKANCKKTCDLCSKAKTPSVPSSISCGSHPSCADWVRNNFCSSAFYTVTQKMQFCGKLCNLC